MELINKELRASREWNRTERLIIFTEYKTTLDYLVTRLEAEYGNEDGAILQLYGGMNDDERESKGNPSLNLPAVKPDKPVEESEQQRLLRELKEMWQQILAFFRALPTTNL